MKPQRLVLTVLVAPLVAFPIIAGGNLMMGALFPVGSGSLFELLQGSLDAGLGALGPAYKLMFFVGIPWIFLLRWLGAFRPRPLEIVGALMGGLPFLTWALGTLLDSQNLPSIDVRHVLTPVGWLLM